MAWNHKNEIIGLLLSFCGITILALLAGLIIPIIEDIRQGHLLETLLPLAALTAITTAAIYAIKQKKQKQKSKIPKQY